MKYHQRKHHIISFFLSALSLGISIGFTDVSFATEVVSPQDLMKSGLNSYQKGHFEEACSYWLEASGRYEKAGKSREWGESLVRLSQAYLYIGQYSTALSSIEKALFLAEASEDRMLTATVLSHVGNIHTAMGSLDRAEDLLNQALSIAKSRGNMVLMATVWNNLGNLFVSQKRHKEALEAYLESVRLARESQGQSLVATALVNASMAMIEDQQANDAMAFLEMASSQNKGLSNTHEKAYRLINIGLSYYKLLPLLPKQKNQILPLAFNTLNEAAMIAEKLDDFRSISYAYGYLGKIYEDERRYQEALELTRRAAFAAQQINAPESLYRWHWQTGRILNSLGKRNEAISSYKLAVDTLESVRLAMDSTYGRQQSMFRSDVGPVYFELIDLLLRQADSFPEANQSEGYLLEAREQLEVFKVFELQDYFQDECVSFERDRITSLETASKTAVVIYPILLSDRTELLVSLPNGLKKFSIPVGVGRLEREVRHFRDRLMKFESRRYLSHAEQMYEWFIRPLEQDLKASRVDTLVFVPDGCLRNVPMSALHDGKKFLIEKYALAITPGLNLTDPRTLTKNDMRVLAVGLSEASQGFPPLPYVEEELKTIGALYETNMLINEDFSIANLEETLLEGSFGIVHIASHGEFNNDIKDSFLLTHEDKLTLEKLDQCIGYFRFREQPLELLTLSACETAVGDDRAALGLAGIAVKAGARSAVATLWSVHDEATAALVSEFYTQLCNPGVSRAMALQRAQLKLIQDQRFDHPAYWSPFLMINNWL